MTRATSSSRAPCEKLLTNMAEAHKRRQVDEHNRQVEENRYVFGRIITCIKLCGKCETALRGHNESADSPNPGIFRCIFETMCEGDARLQRHSLSPYSKGHQAPYRINY